MLHMYACASPTMGILLIICCCFVFSKFSLPKLFPVSSNVFLFLTSIQIVHEMKRNKLELIKSNKRRIFFFLFWNSTLFVLASHSVLGSTETCLRERPSTKVRNSQVCSKNIVLYSKQQTASIKFNKEIDNNRISLLHKIFPKDHQ